MDLSVIINVDIVKLAGMVNLTWFFQLDNFFFINNTIKNNGEKNENNSKTKQIKTM